MSKSKLAINESLPGVVIFSMGFKVMVKGIEENDRISLADRSKIIEIARMIAHTEAIHYVVSVLDIESASLALRVVNRSYQFEAERIGSIDELFYLGTTKARVIKLEVLDKKDPLSLTGFELARIDKEFVIEVINELGQHISNYFDFSTDGTYVYVHLKAHIN